MSRAGESIALFDKWRRWLVLSITYAGFIGAVYFASYHLPDDRFGAYLSGLILLVLAISFYFVWPNRWTFFASPALTVLLWYLLDDANRQKSALTTFPLTIVDLRMLMADPSGLLTAVRAPHWAFIALDIAPYVLLPCLIWLIYWALRRTSPLRIIAGMLGLGVRAAIIATALYFVNQVSIRAVRSFLAAHEDIGVWEDVGLVKFAETVGILPFLSYSQYIESAEGESFLTYKPKRSPPPRAEIMKSAAKYIDFGKLSDTQLPNIFIIHAESTYDLNDVLNLKSPVSSSLFYTYPGIEDPKVQYRGAMLANIVGGGSWVSEYEVLHGIDSRLFGVAGHYTHASLSIYSRNPLPKYLADRGYENFAYYPTTGKFYNGEQAYRRYGFQNFQGDIGHSDDDRLIMAAAVAPSEAGKAGPFMKFVQLLENHAPHWCNDEKAQSYENVELAGNPSEGQKCVVKEYVRRLRDTEQAVKIARDYLEAEQAKTGRPYVIAVYGDHQPFSITGGGYKVYNMGLNFDEFRKDATKRKTVLEFISSKENPIRCCQNEVVPITMVPSLLSAYVAKSPNELYLPENFYQMDHCGSDWIGHLTGSSFYGRGETPPSACPEYESLLAAYKQSGVIGYPDEANIALAAAKVKEPPQPKTIRAACQLWDGSTRIIVSATGTKFGDPPAFDLRIDGDTIGRGSVTAAPETGDKAADQEAIRQAETLFVFSVSLQKQARQITLEFLNDRWAGENHTGDTDLWIRYVQVGDRIFTGDELKPTSPDPMHGVSKGEWFVFPSNGMLKIDLPQDRCS
jgi:hypothetical protein